MSDHDPRIKPNSGSPEVTTEAALTDIERALLKFHELIGAGVLSPQQIEHFSDRAVEIMLEMYESPDQGVTQILEFAEECGDEAPGFAEAITQAVQRRTMKTN